MKLMDSIKPYLSFALVALLAANLFSTISLNRSIDDKLDQLIISQNNVQKAVEENQKQISAINGDLQSELERQASLFSDSSSTVSYSEEGLVVTTKLTPKEYNTDSKITVTCVSNSKSFSKEAVQNGSEFEAICVIPFCETVDISAAITTGEAIEQQPLPSIPCQTILAFDIFSEYSYSENTLYFSVSNPQSTTLLESIESMYLAIVRDGVVVGAAYPEGIASTDLPDSLRGTNFCLAYTADLEPYLTLDGDFQVIPRIESTTELSYIEQPMFHFTATSEGLDSYMTGDSWYPPIFHES